MRAKGGLSDRGSQLRTKGHKTMRKELCSALGLDSSGLDGSKELVTTAATELLAGAVSPGGEEPQPAEDEPVAKKAEPKKRPAAAKSAKPKFSGPGSAMQLFQSERRPKLKEADPTLPFEQISKLLDEEWKGLSEAERADFERRHAEAKASHEEAVAAWSKENPAAERSKKKAKAEDAAGDDGDDDDGKKKKTRAKKDPNAPKQGRTSYFVWYDENRERIKEANPGLKLTELSKVSRRALLEVCSNDSFAAESGRGVEEALQDGEGAVRGAVKAGACGAKGQVGRLLRCESRRGACQGQAQEVGRQSDGRRRGPAEED